MNDLNLIIQTLNTSLTLKAHDWDRIKGYLTPIENQLLHTLLESPNITEEKANIEFQKSNFNNNQYQQTKNKLIDKLIKEFLLFSPNYYNFSNYQRAYYKSYQLFSIFKILLGLGKKGLGKKFSLRLHKLAAKYKFSDIRLETGKFLLKYYTQVDVNQSKIDFYLEDLSKTILAQSAENLGAIAIEKLYNQIINSSAQSVKEIDIAKDEIESLEQFVTSNVESDRFYYDYYSLRIWLFELEEKYDDALSCARTAYEHFRSLSYKHENGMSSFLTQMTNYSLLLGYFTEAQQSILLSIKMRKPGTRNWFISMVLLVQIDLIQKKYDKAFENFKTILKDVNSEDLSEKNRNRILTLSSFFQFMDMHFTSEDRAKVKSIEKLSNDNHESTLAYLIGDIVNNIKNRRWNVVKSQILELDIYDKQRIKKSNKNYRTLFFIKMIKSIEEGYFHPVSVQRHAAKYRAKLSLVPYKFDLESDPVEIIPYEDLWDKLIQILASHKKIKASM